MINLLIGPPGGGKSYEAVVYHVLAAIQEGRKVITNLALNLDEFCRYEPRARTLIEIRNRQGSAAAGAQSWAFGHVDDYHTDWRDPATNRGPLFAIDECHKPLPRRSTFARDPVGTSVDEYYAEHRHTGADFLLMTQSYGKVSKAIIDQVQTTYRVKKATVFGDSSSYIRKVQDGVRGDVLSTVTRTYEPKWFALYKSHTLSVGAVIEADAKDIKPAFLQWRRASHAVIAVGVLLACYSVYGFVSSDDDQPVIDDHAPGAGQGSGSARTEEHAAAAPLIPPPGTLPQSQGPRSAPSMRLVGVFDTGTALAHAVIYDGSGERRIPLRNCGRVAFTGWSCNVDGQDVTFNAGPRPKSSGGSLTESFSGGLMGSSS